MKSYPIICLVCLVIGSCTKEPENNIALPRQGRIMTGTILSDSAATPEVIPITPANDPKPIPAGKPRTKNYSLHPGLGKANISKLDVADEFLTSYNYSIIQDKAGNLWMGGSGLYKYDGSELITFSEINGNELNVPHNIFSQIQDRFGNIWLYGSGLSKFDGKVFTSINAIDSIKNIKYELGDIKQDKSGGFWIGIPQKGLAKFDVKKVTLFDPKDDIEGVYLEYEEFSIDTSGNLFLISNKDGLIKFDGQHYSIVIKKENLPIGEYYAIQHDHEGNLWLGTNQNGAVKYDGNKFITYTTKEGIANNHVGRILKDSFGALWFIHGADGFTKYDGSRFTTFTKEDGLASLSFYFGIIPRNTGVTWITGEGVIERLDNTFTTYENIFTGLSPLPSNDNVSSLIVDRKGNYWFKGMASGIFRYDGKILTNYSTQNGLINDFVYSIIEDRKDNIWFGTDRGLSKFDGKSFKHYTNDNGLKSTWVYDVLEDRAGNIWLATGQSISKFDGHSFLHYFVSKDTDRTKGFYLNFEDSQGNIWFIHTEIGLVKYDGSKFTSYSEKDGLDKTINAIAEDEYQNIWLAGNSGLYRFDGDSIYKYTIEDGLSSNAIYNFKKDTINNVYWLGTGAGLTRLSITANHPDSVAFLNLDKRNGFPIPIAGNFIDTSGAIWLTGETNKLTRFDYAQLKKQMRPFPLHLKSIRLNNEKICWSNLVPHNNSDSTLVKTEFRIRFGKAVDQNLLSRMSEQFKGVQFDSISPFEYIPQNLVLPYAANTISFDFAAIEPYFSKFTSYKYLLEGATNTWSPLSKNTNVNFYNLHEGTYTFKLKAFNSYGIWSEMSYSFKVLPPWYRTWWAYGLYALFFVSFLFLFIRWRTKALQKEKTILEEKVTTRTSELNQSLENLKSTQSQLIQSEKMASLGELTAGIAHEIQNPLNFVNNFSEVSNELIGEIEEERAKNQEARDETLVSEILQDVKSNLEKINHHGKRADAIVKGMLEHSRAGKGEKAPTDINALADEYLRLAYHARLNAGGGQGLRAKDKSFTADFATDLDPNLPKVNVVASDIGRVLLNLINNAFYACAERSKNGEEGYSPKVLVSSRQENGKVLISVQDNGSGIPTHIKEKIFQPFFTTKPTGQGTGLGLSLSYDIVKAHGGELRVETKEGEGSEFIIILKLKE